MFDPILLDNMSTAVSPQLSFKKWGFPDQEQILDFAPAGKENQYINKQTIKFIIDLCEFRTCY